MSEPEKKSDIVRRLVAEGDYKKALSIVKGFRLGITRDDSGKMTQAYECYVHPDFFRQLGIDPDTSIAEGTRILKAFYGQKEDCDGTRECMHS